MTFAFDGTQVRMLLTALHRVEHCGLIAVLQQADIQLDFAYTASQAAALASRHHFDVALFGTPAPALCHCPGCRIADVVVMLHRPDVAPDYAAIARGATDSLPASLPAESLMTRILTYLARRDAAQCTRLRHGDLTLDLRAHQVYLGGRPVRTYPQGRKVLELLIRNAPGTVPAHTLAHVLWGEEASARRDQLRQIISQLRQSLGPDGAAQIVTVPRAGYRLVAAIT